MLINHNMSSSATKTDNGIEFSPLRSLNDFLLESGRFQVPNLKDFEKWGKMVVQNLLYYQTNYFILGLVIFTIVGVIHPTQMFVGLISFALVVAGFSHASDAHSQITSFKQSHPLICLAIFLAVLYLLFQFVGSLLVFLLGILLPIAVSFVHASLRLRNLNNKIVNKMEMVGLKKTPMGVILGTFGIEYTPFQ
ncbi:PRA1 family protein 3-like isoform X1 [Artemia franciscana]|uniref:PRA1 family protein 3-like isoform X1 n=2 Tax=Artemia franciscana TaxID=6661 RepID=UPI0032DB6ECE